MALRNTKGDEDMEILHKGNQRELQEREMWRKDWSAKVECKNKLNTGCGAIMRVNVKDVHLGIHSGNFNGLHEVYVLCPECKRTVYFQIPDEQFNKLFN